MFFEDDQCPGTGFRLDHGQLLLSGAPLLALAKTMCYNVPVVYALKGRLHDAVTWYGINYAGTQATQCEFRCFESPTVKLVSQRNLFRTM